MDNPTFLEFEVVKSNIHDALSAWQKTSSTPENLLDSLLLVQLRRQSEAKNGTPVQLRYVTNSILLEGIEELGTQDARAARILHLRFPEDNKLMTVASKLNISEPSVSREQRAAIEHLTQIILTREIALREERALWLETFLPPSSYTRLYGFDDASEVLAKQLLLKNVGPSVTAIVGIGGSGKTALADKVTRAVIRHFYFHDVVWIRVEPYGMNVHEQSHRVTYEKLITDLAQRLYPTSANEFSPDERLVKVRKALKEKPILVVVDNLESEVDAAFLLDHLNDLAEPSKFLLTSRVRLSNLATVFNYSLHELSFDDACQLLRNHAHEIGITSADTIEDTDFHSIYEVTGGNPLALKLIVSLLDSLPLPQILNQLKAGDTGSAEGLFRRIYWQAWQFLSQAARDLLMAMPLVAESGGAPEYLAQLSGLPETKLWPALQELRSRSLIEVRGTVKEKQYGIHRLTETFLHTEIINWPISPDES